MSDDDLTRTTAPLNPIKKIGEFTLGAEISRGGMGVVYQGMDEDLKRAVAIKMLPKEYFKSTKDRDRFILEAQIVAKLNHPNIMQVYAIRHAEETVWIVMELLRGDILTRLIKEKKRIPPDQALPILQQLVDGLAYAHHKGIVHRDIKPGNVMVGPDGLVKLMDFGIARDESADLHLTQEGSILGTPKYMSPEQFSGGQLDHRTDIYALGVMAFEMLTGKGPFPANNLASIAYKHIHEAPPSLRKEAPDTPPHLEKFVMQCLAKKMEDRPQTLQGLRLVPTAGPSPGRVWMVRVLLVLLLSGLGLTTFIYLRHLRVQKQVQLADQHFITAREALANGDDQAFQKHLAEAMTTHPARAAYYEETAAKDLELHRQRQETESHMRETQAKTRARVLFQKALHDLDGGDLNAFETKLAEVVALEPKQAAQYLAEGESARQIFQKKMARRHYENAVREMGVSRFQEAETLLKESLALDDTSFDTWLLLADVHFESLAIPEYIEATEKALSLDPMNETLWYQIITAYSQLHEGTKARDAMDRALKNFPNSDRLLRLEKSL